MKDEQIHQNLTITEIYKSIQGESSFAGWPCVFIRLTGCPLRCRWCDTAYGFEGGQAYTVSDVLSELAIHKVQLVELTGGEPLAQAGAVGLMGQLISQGYKVLLETGGSESIDQVPAEVHVIMDIKCPGSRMSEKNYWPNLQHLKPSDEIKFVIADRGDFDWAVAIMRQYDLEERFTVLVSPAFGLLEPKLLVEWVLEAGLRVRLNLQIHKFIWSPRARGV